MTEKIKKFTEEIKQNPEFAEPDMQQYMQVMIEMSLLTGSRREGALKCFSEYYAAGFGDKFSPNTETAMWKLFRKVANKVIVDNYQISAELEEEVLEQIMRISTIIAKHKGNEFKYSNKVELDYLTSLKDEYLDLPDAAFALETEAAFQEIVACM